MTLRHDRLKRILVIDDEPALLKVLATVLQQSGFQVFTARSGKEARQLSSNIR